MTYCDCISTFFCSRARSSGRPGRRSGGTSSPPTSVCLSFSAGPSSTATLALRLSDGLLVMLSLACFRRSPKLVGGCEGNADCTNSFAWCRDERWRWCGLWEWCRPWRCDLRFESCDCRCCCCRDGASELRRDVAECRRFWRKWSAMRRGTRSVAWVSRDRCGLKRGGPRLRHWEIRAKLFEYRYP